MRSNIKRNYIEEDVEIIFEPIFDDDGCVNSIVMFAKCEYCDEMHPVKVFEDSGIEFCEEDDEDEIPDGYERYYFH